MQLVLLGTPPLVESSLSASFSPSTNPSVDSTLAFLVIKKNLAFLHQFVPPLVLPPSSQLISALDSQLLLLLHQFQSPSARHCNLTGQLRVTVSICSSPSGFSPLGCVMPLLFFLYMICSLQVCIMQFALLLVFLGGY